MQPPNRLVDVLVLAALGALVLVIPGAGPAHAQTTGTVGVGAGVGVVRPRAPELRTSPRLRPTVRRLPSRGWGFAAALNWFDAEVDAASVGAAGRLGDVAIRPLMAGVGYTAVRGRFGISPSFVAGPSLNTLTIDERWEGLYSGAGSSFEERLGTVSLAARPGVGLTYALAPRLAATGFAGYLINRPGITVRTPGGEQRLTWNTDGIVLNVGLLVSVF